MSVQGLSFGFLKLLRLFKAKKNNNVYLALSFLFHITACGQLMPSREPVPVASLWFSDLHFTGLFLPAVKRGLALTGTAPLAVLSCRAKGRQFDSWSGHLPGFQVWSPVGACARENWTDVSLTHQCFSPSLSPSLHLSMKINK